MDFDDLDDEIDARIEAGDTEGLDAIASTLGKRELQKFVPTTGMTPIPRDHRLPISPEGQGSVSDPDRTIYLRLFIFYGPGVNYETYKFVETFPGWMEAAVYEYPGHGSRAQEPFAEDLDALGEDALAAVKPAMEEVCRNGAMEGAPFVFVGHSVGCQVLTYVARKLLLQFGIAPSAVVMLDRAPLQFPLLSEEGKAMLESNPEDVLQAFDFNNFPMMDKKLWANDLKYACEERDPFFHKFECDVLVLTADGNQQLEHASKNLGSTGASYKLARLQIEDSDESITLPVEGGVKVKVLKETLAGIFASRKDTAKITVFNSEKTVLKDDDDVQESLIISGLQDFKYPKYPWPHPSGIIGTGFNGIKTAMQYMVHHNENIVLFDRMASCGGLAWMNAATKHSKIQTDFGAFNIWYGHEYCWSGDGGYGAKGMGPPEKRNVFAQPFNGTGAGSGVDFHPVRQQVVNAMQYACDEYGITKYVHFETDIIGLDIIGKEDEHDRYYKLTGKNLSKSGGGNKTSYQVSIVYHYPGAYDINRIIDYPGESTFGGQIGYGMGHDGQGCSKFCWDDGRMKHARGGIVGNGAFSIENVRSCAEHGATKVFLITRRKSLACPRVPCWFCHQGPIPTPAYFLLDFFKPMYELGKGVFDDPFDYYAVQRNGPENVTLSQSSRFGIGDVTFICAAYGILEYRVTVLEKLSPKTLILKTGEKLEKCSFLIKALGLLGDPRVDKLHALTHRIGNFCNGDWRRLINADATGMHAANFATFSAGPAACALAKQWYYIHMHPWEMYSAIEQGLLKIMPKHTLSNTQPDQTVYMTNIQYEMGAGGLFGQYFPNLGRVFGDEGSYKYCLLHEMHPTDKFLEYCRKDWDRYQKLLQENNGITADWVPYPYTEEMIQGWFQRYNEKFPFFPTKWEGPDAGFKEWTIKQYKDDWERRQQEHIPLLIKESALCESSKTSGTDPYMAACVGTMAPKRKKYMGSSSNSTLDFDLASYGEWQNWMDSEYTYTQEGLPCTSADILNRPETWGRILPLVESKSSQHNLEEES